jgi:hypothetical protein
MQMDRHVVLINSIEAHGGPFDLQEAVSQKNITENL